jgi:hypothetical protein
MGKLSGDKAPTIQLSQYQDWSLYIIPNHPNHLPMPQLGSLMPTLFSSHRLLGLPYAQFLTGFPTKAPTYVCVPSLTYTSIPW